MPRIASYFVLAASAVTVLSVAACTGGEVAVGRSDQQLLSRKDGTPTGNGQTCSWDDTVAYDVATGKETTTPAPNGPYEVGDTFPSLDGCNDCSCTKEGIMCTMRACAGDPGGPACTDDAMICPDGSSVGRTGPNCEFAPCPGADRCKLPYVQGPCEAAFQVFWFDAATGKCEQKLYGGCGGNENRFDSEQACLAACGGNHACDADAKLCPDGSTVGRTGPNCEFAPCPGTFCSADAKLCPDGTWVGRSGPNCEFVCP